MRMSEEDWDTVLDTNLKGAFLFTKGFARTFVRQRSGRIINVSSVIGIMGNAGQCNYAASKAGLFGFTKSIARELASRGVTVNAIAPGPIEDTEGMGRLVPPEVKEKLRRNIPLGRFGRIKDIEQAAIFLCSDAASFINGAILVVDGGQWLSSGRMLGSE